MADERDNSERSEDPTQKRLDEALERGDVAKSQEVNTWFVLAAATLLLLAFSAPAAGHLAAVLRGLIANSYAFAGDGRGLLDLAGRIGVEVIAAMAIPLLLLALAAVAGNVIQHRLVWSAEALKPKLSKISPAGGIKRLFSKQALVNFIKGLAKLALVGSIISLLLWHQRDLLDGLVTTDPAAILPLTRALSLETLGTVIAVLALIAAADFMFQYRHWYARQKMSLRDLKEEFKQTEGDPAVKGRIRQIRQTRMRKRMMAALPTASVVIVNPTHYAVALKYDRSMNAPVCVAKGVDVLARRIRNVAEEHAIPVVENPPLARALHATVEIDQEIRPEHYQAVAEVIGYVMRLSRKLAGGGNR